MPEVVLCYYAPKVCGDFGHVAIKISEIPDRSTYPDGLEYISYWPGEGKSFCCDPFGNTGELVDKNFDDGQYPTCLDVDLTSLDLDIDKMLQEGRLLKEYVNKSRWWLCAEFMPNPSKKKSIATCSTTVMRVLHAGGINKYFPLHQSVKNSKK